MTSGAIPFRIDVTDLLGRARRRLSGHLGEVTLNLPFISFAISPKNREREVAREIVIRLQDRRVLDASECCDNCIDRALASLQEIRRTLVDKQVELSDLRDGPLYLLIDMMAAGIRQFLTYEQHLAAGGGDWPAAAHTDFRRPMEIRQSYFDALELLRGHLSRCLTQVAVIAGMDMPTGGMLTHYQGPWLAEAYVPLPPPSDVQPSNP